MKVSHQDFADSPYAFRGKRSKRLRPSSPVCQPGTMVTTSSSTAGDSNDDGGDGEGNFYYSSSIQNSPTTSTTQISTSSTSEEDEDMANCLILLAQSGGCRKVQVVTSEVKKENISSRKFTEMVSTTTGSKAGFYVYECKTCNRTFPSFQALGGHRASHKRPKTVVLEEKKHVTSTTTVTAASLANNNNEDHDQENDQEEGQVKKLSPSLSIKIVNNNKGTNNSHDNCNDTSKSKIHECAICGSEFSSGQALGGHMRRHRPPPPTTTAAQITKISTTIRLINETGSDVSESSQKNNFLSLDLNLPAPPEDDHVRDTKFDFSANKQSLVFSTAALVDCHY